MALTSRMLVFLQSLYVGLPYWEDTERHLEQAFRLLSLDDAHMLKIGGTIQKARNLIESKNYRSAYGELCTARPYLEMWSAEHPSPDLAGQCESRVVLDPIACDIQAAEAPSQIAVDQEQPNCPAGSPASMRKKSLLFFRQRVLLSAALLELRRSCLPERPPRLWNDDGSAEDARQDDTSRHGCHGDAGEARDAADAAGDDSGCEQSPGAAEEEAEPDGADHHRYVFVESMAKLKNADTRVTKKGVLPIGEFTFTFYPKRASQKKGGSSFKASKGHCTTHVKCNSGLGCEVLMAVGLGDRPPRVRVRHDFSKDSVCIVPDVLDLRKAVDESARNFCVVFGITVLGASSHL